MALAGALAGARVVLWFMGKVGWLDAHPEAGQDEGRRDFGATLAFIAGIAIAWPTYSAILGAGGSAAIVIGRWTLIQGVSMAAGFLALVPLAVWCWRHAPPGHASSLRVIIAAGFILVLSVPVLALPEGNEHNIANVASCLLAAPAAAWASIGARSRVRSAALALAFVPASAGLAFAFAGRGDLPIRFEAGAIHREPAGGPLDAFYQWIRTATPREAVFVSDPVRVVKMSGNVAELPAFTGRSLFVDQKTYMTDPYPDRQKREAIAIAAVNGDDLPDEARPYLRALGRPLFVVSYVADQPGVLERLEARFGPPAFHRGFVAAFELKLAVRPSP
jgi:hypothetical protein